MNSNNYYTSYLFLPDDNADDQICMWPLKTNIKPGKTGICFPGVLRTFKLPSVFGKNIQS